jgi:signal transduction histidine kinase
MTIATRLNNRITHLAVGPHLPQRKVRVRLTLLYGFLFLLSGAALMAITYALLVNAGFVFSLQNGPGSEVFTGRAAGGQAGAPTPGSATRPSAQTMAHWRDVAQCMRQHGVSKFPTPTTSVPINLRYIGEVSDRDGAILVIPTTVNMQSPVFARAATDCGFSPPASAQANDRRTQARNELLIQSGIALAGMSLLSLCLGWLMAGRVLQPLENSYQAQRQFVANASHELRAPLTRQRTLIQVALANPDANFASVRAAHERVLASEQQLEELIEGLLALSRSQAGLEHREQLDLAALADEALSAYEAEFAGLDLQVHSTLDAAPTTGDTRLIERLITNLIDNAIRHNSAAGYVEIVTGTRERRAFLSVANTGAIVPPEQINRLFEPFQRLGTARTRHAGGHGLGLSIVEAIADVHRAQLTARARPEGGLSIELVFPSASRRGSKPLPWLPARAAPARRSA